MQMQILTEHTLKIYSDKICNIYSKYIYGKLNQAQASESIGFLISYLKQYEQEEGLHPDRIVCVLPRCANIIKLRINYNMTIGTRIWRLDLEPDHNIRYRVVNNTLSEPEDKILEEDDIEEEVDVSPVSYVCKYKNRSCCYLNNDHNSKCKECCIGKVHTAVK